MKILLASNAPWVKTGYGTQAASLARRLRDAGHQVTFYCMYGLDGGTQQWEGITCLPNNGGGYTDPIIRGHLRYTQPDLLITLYDLWPLSQNAILGYIQESGAKWLAWFPIDAVPVSVANLDVISQVDYPVCLSNFAEKELASMAPDFKVEVIPHGIEKDFGWTANGRREFRRSIQVPEDAFLFGSVGRNAYYPGRKGFDRLIRAFAECDLPNSYLYLHTSRASESGSVPIERVIEFYDRLHPGLIDRVKLPDDYNLVMGYSQEGMNALYSALDCYVQTTSGEGFGIPVMEAQACGCAVIATDCTSMPDIVCPHSSELIPGATEIMVPDISHRVLIDIPKLKEAMTRIYEIKRDDPDGFLAMKGNAGLWANGWDWDRLWHEYWLPLLGKIETEIRLSPRRDWHRGGAMVFETEEGLMRKQESILKSPVVAKILALRDRLDHPSLIPIVARGVTEDGLHWFDMPKLTPLRDIDPKTLTAPQRSAILGDVRAGLQYLHSQGVAHRDVCPENVVVDMESDWARVEGPRAYLIDFEWAGPCDGEIGKNCVDFEPWAAMDMAVPVMQRGMEERGFHTIVNYVRDLPLDRKTHGFKSIPYQAVDGVGERDCETRWKIMKPDVFGKRVLDVGCNLGWFIRKSIEEGASYAVGIENDEAVVEAARRLTPDEPAVVYKAMDAGQLNGEFGKFDTAFLLSVLQHVEDPDDLMRRVLHVTDEVYIEIPARFMTPYIAGVLQNATYLGESERGRPLYRVQADEVFV